MKVLFLSLETSPDNIRDEITYNFIVKEMVALSERGIHVFFLCFSNNHQGRLPGISMVNAEDLISERWIQSKISDCFLLVRNYKMYGKRLLSDIPRALWRLYCDRAVCTCVEKYGIDLIHTHFFVPDGGGGVVAKKETNVPVIATCRGAEICNLPEYGYGALQSNYFHSALSAAISHFDAITVPNIFYRKGILKLFPELTSDKVSVLYNGIEAIHVRTINDKCNLVPLFIAIGNLIPLKNYNLLLQAVAKLIDRYDFQVIIVGDGVLRGSFEKTITADFQNVIRLHSEVSKNKLYAMLATADCLIHPSLSEGGANVILEALAIGVPCLVSNIDSMQKEIIKEGVNGFFFDPHDASELAVKMEYVINNREAMFDMKDNCWKSVKPYTVENKIDGYLALYQKVLDQKLGQ